MARQYSDDYYKGNQLSQYSMDRYINLSEVITVGRINREYKTVGEESYEEYYFKLVFENGWFIVLSVNTRQFNDSKNYDEYTPYDEEVEMEYRRAKAIKYILKTYKQVIKCIKKGKHSVKIPVLFSIN